MKLPTCIHVGIKPMSDLLEPIMDSYDFGSRDKPFGGLWTSVLDKKYGTDWLRYVQLRGSIIGRHGDHTAWQVHAKEDAKVLHIDSLEAYEKTKEQYPRIPENVHMVFGDSEDGVIKVDWEAVAKEYDVIWVGKEAWTHIKTWDCETILFTRWSAIAKVENHAWSTKRLIEKCLDQEKEERMYV